MEHKANLEIEKTGEASKYTIIQEAIENDQPKEVIEILINLKADINEINEDGQNSLHFLLKNEFFSYEKLEIFLKKKVNINVVDYSNNFPLYYFLLNPLFDINSFKLLIEYKVDLKILNNTKRFNSLLLYCDNKKFDLENFKSLFLYDGDVNHQDSNGETVLHHAIKNSKIPISSIEYILNIKANVNTKSGSNFFILFYYFYYYFYFFIFYFLFFIFFYFFFIFY